MIDLKDLNILCDVINEMTGSPKATYTRTEGRYIANIGNFHLSQANGGVCLHRILNEGGGVSCPIINCHVPKKDLFNQMQAFIAGMRFDK